MFTRRAAASLFINQRLQRWCFDVELVYLANRLGVPIKEVQVRGGGGGSVGLGEGDGMVPGSCGCHLGWVAHSVELVHLANRLGVPIKEVQVRGRYEVGLRQV